ncbi:peptidylprolyl isomerase [Curvibacter sp. CHRR-16]|uniref:peptidylprolyl isomerase n=1 Tax=Curvibacter sp. CHRR-16 TaxID=2835872 RepID=UPI001BD9619D|nr:peptidylprolyl isomerase [Curvibacter sp. CHRR-16]MBT0571133.1 peptidylprolyl isomerase [Curvibacter sp. CHRR-16]
MMASINGVALHAAGEQLDDYTLRERAYSELLRQQAVQVGLLAPCAGTQAPMLSDADRLVLETMVDAAVHSPLPSEDECQRYYQAHLAQYVVGQSVHVRHILFAVTPGVNVHALTVRAEQALLELLGKNVPADHFATLAAQLSNCPSSAQGGDLGWLQAQDCAPELANELFHQTQAGWGLGVHPRLIHTRFGFHIIEVLGQRKGKQAAYSEVRERVAMQLTLQSRAKALHQYMRLLVGQAEVQGITLDAADSLLVQ